MTPVTLAEIEHRGSPNCYIGIDKNGQNAVIDKWGNTHCTNCYKNHTFGYKHEGCPECGGPERKEDEMDEIKAFNVIKYGKPQAMAGPDIVDYYPYGDA